MSERMQTGRSSNKGLRLLVLLSAVIIILIICFFIFRGRKPVPQEDFSVRVVFKSNANYLIYFIARDKGFLRDAGLHVQESELESTNLMIQALGSGQADFNPSTSVPALYAAEQNAPGTFKFLFITLMEKGKTNNAIIVKKDSPFKTLGELKGKKVACPPGATSIVLLKLIFADIGLNVDKDITIQELEPRDQLQALAADQVDAAFAIEPTIALGAEKGISRILEAESMENHIMNPIPIAGGVVTDRFAQTHPETVKRLQQAMERSIDYTRQHEDESRLIMARAINMPEGTAKRLGVNTYWKLSEVNKDFVQKLADIFMENGALQRPVNTKNMYVASSSQ
jgi:NitT/TauT family transport system substrate-binding protein